MTKLEMEEAKAGVVNPAVVSYMKYLHWSSKIHRHGKVSHGKAMDAIWGDVATN